MNICILSKTTLDHHIGGMEVHLDILSKTVAAMGHSVTIITTAHPQGKSHEESANCNVYYLNTTKPGRYSASWWRESTRKFAELHKKCAFDIVWSQAYSGYYYATKIKRKACIPLLTIIHGTLLGHVRSEWNRLETMKEYGTFITKTLPEALLFYTLWFYRTLRNSEMVIGVSAKTVEDMKREFFGTYKRAMVVLNGIDTSVFKPDMESRTTIRQKYSIGENDKVIGMVGVIHRQKGMHYGLMALQKIKKKVPGAKVMVVGGGPDLNWLKGLAVELNIEDSVIFCGSIPNTELSGYYNACDVFISPTVRIEGLPIVILEAMSCGKPQVVSDVGGIGSAVEDGINGFLVQPKNKEALTNAIITVLSDDTLAAEMSRNARHKVEREFSREKMAGDYLDLSLKVIEGKTDLENA